MSKKPKPLVLLVDDDPNDEELARIALDQTNISHELFVCRDGAEALQYLNSKEPQLIILDLKLPKVTGLEVLEKLRAVPKSRFIPVVVFTSSNEEKDIKASYEHGANAYIRKPIDFNEYQETICETAKFWIRRNQPFKLIPLEKLFV